jgi:hypothetical protein
MPIGTPLFIIAEPDNQYDPNAIAVWVETKDIGPQMQQSLEPELGPFGFDIEQILTQDAWHLGYVPKEMAAKITSQGVLGSGPYMGSFSVSAGGAPRFRSTDAFDV